MTSISKTVPTPICRGEVNCRTCRFYDFVSSLVEDTEGYCRRNAPQPFLVTEKENLNGGYEEQVAQWPLVKWNDGCGEWSENPLLEKMFDEKGEILPQSSDEIDWDDPETTITDWRHLVRKDQA